MQLKDTNVNDEMQIISLDTVSDKYAFRLQEMGLREGSVIRVVQNAVFGGKVITSSAARYALDGKTAREIEVELVK
ncbi:MAG: ferrous iron transport protein A [Bifidobacteriaceae bacterium]|jgi:ferrous iron transport protein A|nr:ferrous iron transport protein A [Bifidobacteriaceae bacterium]